MNPCPCGGKPILRRPGGIAAHLDHSKAPDLFSVVCSMSSSRYRKCLRRTKLHLLRADAEREWNDIISVSSPASERAKEAV